MRRAALQRAHVGSSPFLSKHLLYLGSPAPRNASFSPASWKRVLSRAWWGLCPDVVLLATWQRLSQALGHEARVCLLLVEPCCRACGGEEPGRGEGQRTEPSPSHPRAGGDCDLHSRVLRGTAGLGPRHTFLGVGRSFQTPGRARLPEPWRKLTVQKLCCRGALAPFSTTPLLAGRAFLCSAARDHLRGRWCSGMVSSSLARKPGGLVGSGEAGSAITSFCLKKT